MAKSRETPVKFEDALEQVETIIEQIESGQVGLEECIQQYEQGMKLLARCQSILSTAQKRIEELTADGHGRLKIRGEGSASAAGSQQSDEDQDGDVKSSAFEAEIDSDDEASSRGQ